MNCVVCGERTRPPSLETVPYRAAPGVKLEGVAVYHCSNPKCGESFTEYPNLAGLEAQIAERVARRPGRLDGRSLRFLRRALDWSGQDMARHLGVQAETVSRWENGALTMAEPSERLLRLCVLYRGSHSMADLETQLARTGEAAPDAPLVVDLRALAPASNGGRIAANPAAHLALVA